VGANGPSGAEERECERQNGQAHAQQDGGERAPHAEHRDRAGVCDAARTGDRAEDEVEHEAAAADEDGEQDDLAEGAHEEDADHAPWEADAACEGRQVDRA
jgi:hypothetical protein